MLLPGIQVDVGSELFLCFLSAKIFTWKLQYTLFFNRARASHTHTRYSQHIVCEALDGIYFSAEGLALSHLFIVHGSTFRPGYASKEAYAYIHVYVYCIKEFQAILDVKMCQSHL